MAVKFDRLLYGGDYNPDQWLNTRRFWKRISA